MLDERRVLDVTLAVTLLKIGAAPESVDSTIVYAVQSALTNRTYCTNDLEQARKVFDDWVANGGIPRGMLKAA